MGKSNNWTVPNILTVARILMTPAIVVAYLNRNYAAAWGLFMLAGITDGLDGFLARILRQRSNLGSMLDPLADKILLVTSFGCLAAQEAIPFWLAVMVIFRDLIIVGGLGLLHFSGVKLEDKIKPLWSSKVTTALQLLLVFLVLLQLAFGLDWNKGVEMLYLPVAFFTGISGAVYVWQGLGMFSESRAEDNN